MSGWKELSNAGPWTREERRYLARLKALASARHEHSARATARRFAEPFKTQGADEMNMAVMNTLTPAERDELVDLEATIEAGIQTFFDVGGALLEIRERRLYRADFETFDAYCDDRWGFTRQRASQLIQGARTVKALEAGGVEDLPANEAQARALSALAPERRADAWTLAVERAGGAQPTAGQVKQVVDEMLGKAGRFQKGMYYPYDEKAKLVYNQPFKSYPRDDEAGMFYGGQWMPGDRLNNERQYDAYALIDVPDFHPAPITDTWPGFNPDFAIPVDDKNPVIYMDDVSDLDWNARRELYGDSVYATRGTRLLMAWNSISMRWCEFELRPAKVRTTATEIPPAAENAEASKPWQNLGAGSSLSASPAAPAEPDKPSLPRPSDEIQDALDEMDTAQPFLELLLRAPDKLQAALDDPTAVAWARDQWGRYRGDEEEAALPDWLLRAARWLLAISDAMSRAVLIDDPVSEDDGQTIYGPADFGPADDSDPQNSPHASDYPVDLSNEEVDEALRDELGEDDEPDDYDPEMDGDEGEPDDEDDVDDQDSDFEDTQDDDDAI